MSSTISRDTFETSISCTLHLTSTTQSTISTGIGFLDHMLSALAKHSKSTIILNCKGDLHVDDHHTVEDVGLVLGTCFKNAIQEKSPGLKGIRRYYHSL